MVLLLSYQMGIRRGGRSGRQRFITGSSHHHRGLYGFAGLCQRQKVPRYGRTIDHDGDHALLHGMGVLHADMVDGPAVAAGDSIAR